MGTGTASSRTVVPGLRLMAGALVFACTCLLGAGAQDAAPEKTLIPNRTPGAAPNNGQGVLVDQVVAVVNGEPILESDVQEENRFQAFEPVRALGREDTREETVGRLIDRELILQQAALQQDQGVSTVDAEKELLGLRREIPACRQFHCETDAGWQRYVQAQGFTRQELVERWKQRMEILKYIELRFRSGIVITPAQIRTYYTDDLLPEYADRKAAAPPLTAVSARIGEVLLEQQVSKLLEDWLKSLKAEGNVRVIRSEGVAG